jgi:hypothetical protein
VNKNVIPKKVLNMKIKGKFPRGKLRSRWEQHFRRDVILKEIGTWDEVGRQR